MWIQLNAESRIVGTRTSEPSEVDAPDWTDVGDDARFSGLGDDFYEYLLVDGEVVHEPVPPTPEEMAERALAEAIRQLPETMPEVEAALCELYEQAREDASVTDAAICELYEMIGG